MKKGLAHRLVTSMGMAGALASTMLLVSPASAQDSRLSLAERVSRLEQQTQNQDKGGVGMVNQVQALQSQLRDQQGQIEQLQHQLQQLEDKSKSQYVDLDSRLGRLEGGAGAGQNTTAGSAAAPASTAAGGGGADAPASASSAGGQQNADQPDAKPAYEAAFNTLKGGDYAQASRAFRQFIQQYPGSSLEPNAWYWLGESYYVTTNYPLAQQSFQHLLSQFPNSEKAPDALLKLGYSQYELKQNDAAQATLKSVVSRYPGTNAAGLAQQRLSRMQPAG